MRELYLLDRNCWINLAIDEIEMDGKLPNDLGNGWNCDKRKIARWSWNGWNFNGQKIAGWD